MGDNVFSSDGIICIMLVVSITKIDVETLKKIICFAYQYEKDFPQGNGFEWDEQQIMWMLQLHYNVVINEFFSQSDDIWWNNW